MQSQGYNKAMKKPLLIVTCFLLLTACERSATFTNWSPINDVGTPVPAALDGTDVQNTPSGNFSGSSSSENPTPWPTLDFAQLPDQLPESMKGYELVSWQTNEDWNFTLITGTDRSKTFEEIMAPDSRVGEDGFVKITVSGDSQIKKVFDRLPANTQVFWSGMDLSGQVPEGTVYFTYPSKKIMNDLMNYCAKIHINLVVLAEPQ